jgi:hypothetical protein
MRAGLAVFVLLALGQATPERLEVTGKNVLSFYKGFDRLTERPMAVSASLSTLCVSPVPDLLEAERERAGPHAQTLVHLYSHGVDRSTFAAEERRFPAGTLVVKEKLAADLRAEGVGGMQKMEPGYDPEGGDWLYFYASRSGSFTSGRLESCRSCHLRAKASDFVYYVAGHDTSRTAR